MFVAASAAAQPAVVGRGEGGAIYGGGQSLTSKLGLTVGRNLVYSAEPDDRVRAVDRLASLGTPEAIEALLEAMETGSPLARDPVARLAVVRALAPFADRDDVRTFLVREMMDAGARRDVTSGLAALVRDTAALALARKGDIDSIKALSTAGALRGPAGEAARSAMVAVPPGIIDPILFEQGDDDASLDQDDEEDASSKRPGSNKGPAKDKKADKKGEKKKKKQQQKDDEPKRPERRTARLLTAPVIQFLGDLGDLRALRALRLELDRSDRPTRAAAALALAKVGDGTIAKVVKPWLDDKDPRFALAAADVLVVLGDPSAPAAVKRVLDKEQVRSQAVRLAYDVASPEIAEPLAKLVPSLDPPDQVRALMALGRAGAASKLLAHLDDPKLGPAAVTALGSCPSKEAREQIEKGIGNSSAASRRAFVRAAIVRAIVLQERSKGLDAALTELANTKDAANTEVAALGRIALGSTDLESVLAETKGKDAATALAIVSGAARGALALPSADLEPLARELDDADPHALTPRQIAAGTSLLSSDAADTVPFLKLLQIAEAGGALAPLAARALPRRADESMKERLLALLDGTDPSVRVGLALGLAESPHSSAVSFLARAYVREDDVQVRRALVASLARRTEVQRVKILELARNLDPDSEVRALAASGLGGGQPPASIGRGGVDSSLAAYFAVSGADGTRRARTLRVVLPSGLAVPMVTATDGGLLAPGVPFGKASLELIDTDESAKTTPEPKPPSPK